MLFSGQQSNAVLFLAQDKPLSEDVDAASLARRTAGFSGAELANLVNEAALAAGKGGHARITSGMLDEAQDKILMGSERRQGPSLYRCLPNNVLCFLPWPLRERLCAVLHAITLVDWHCMGETCLAVIMQPSDHRLHLCKILHLSSLSHYVRS